MGIAGQLSISPAFRQRFGSENVRFKQSRDRHWETPFICSSVIFLLLSCPAGFPRIAAFAATSSSISSGAANSSMVVLFDGCSLSSILQECFALSASNFPLPTEFDLFWARSMIIRKLAYTCCKGFWACKACWWRSLETWYKHLLLCFNSFFQFSK